MNTFHTCFAVLKIVGVTLEIEIQSGKTTIFVLDITTNF